MADIAEDKGIFRIVPARHAAVITRRLLARYVWIGIAIYLLLAYFGLRGGGDLRFALVSAISRIWQKATGRWRVCSVQMGCFA